MWNVLWPLAIYMIAQLITSVVGLMTVGEDSAILCLLIAALISIPIYYKIHKKDAEMAGEVKRNIPLENIDFGVIIVSGAALAVAMNNIISITPLPYIFTGYEETNEILFSEGIVLQILAAGIFGCIVEEVSLRGVIYPRMKRYWGKNKAMIFSAIVFGIYHLNVVQAVYAFFLGLFFAWVYERYDSLWAPIAAHMSANLFVILFGSSAIVNRLLSNLVVDLEFVEKEPDTLKSLTEEYQEQEREDK